jgi:nicotinamidase-related amidase
MPHVSFDSLPPNARLWVFGAGAPLNDAARTALLHTVDTHLDGWAAHGTPLVCARDWRDDRFVAVGVDEEATGASGCSIDGLFRTLTALQAPLGTSLVGGGTVFWRNAAGDVQSGTRAEFREAGAQRAVTRESPVFDLSVTSVGDWREHFERPAAESWHAALLPPADR